MSQKEKILIIEDDVFLGDLMSKKLKQEGFEVIHATDGQQGIEKAKETNPDLILLDLILPEMDGFEALKTLKSYDWRGNIRELRNVVERLIILGGDKITEEDVNLFGSKF